jgi:hypothetical protein
LKPPADPVENTVDNSNNRDLDKPSSTEVEVTRASKSMAIACRYERPASELEKIPNDFKVGRLFVTLAKGTEVLDGCPFFLFLTVPTSLGTADLSEPAPKDRKPIVIGVFNLVLGQDISACYYRRAVIHDPTPSQIQRPVKSSDQTDDKFPASQEAGNSETPSGEVIRCDKI